VAGVERELADQLALEVDDADVLVGDQELELAVLVGSADADFVEPAVIAKADLAAGVDLVLAHRQSASVRRTLQNAALLEQPAVVERQAGLRRGLT
jgi:hypothetical protein